MRLYHPAAWLAGLGLLLASCSTHPATPVQSTGPNPPVQRSVALFRPYPLPMDAGTLGRDRQAADGETGDVLMVRRDDLDRALPTLRRYLQDGKPVFLFAESGATLSDLNEELLVLKVKGEPPFREWSGRINRRAVALAWHVGRREIQLLDSNMYDAPSDRQLVRYAMHLAHLYAPHRVAVVPPALTPAKLTDLQYRVQFVDAAQQEGQALLLRPGFVGAGLPAIRSYLDQGKPVCLCSTGAPLPQEEVRLLLQTASLSPDVCDPDCRKQEVTIGTHQKPNGGIEHDFRPGSYRPDSSGANFPAWCAQSMVDYLASEELTRQGIDPLTA